MIGGGFAGTLFAINLLRHDGPRVVLIERAARAGVGLAYGAAHPGQLLNVRAANMSAFPDNPTHLQRWLSSRGMADDGASFVPRLVYGEYLRELLNASLRSAGDRLEIVRDEVVGIEERGGVRKLTLASGATLAVDAVMLALGNLPPHAPPGVDAVAAAHPGYVGDPWATGALDGIEDGDDVLVLGTGLTMVDVALTLRAKRFGGRVIALSRRGLLPHAHAPAGVPASRLAERPGETGAALVRRIRARSRDIGWRAAIDELRPFTQAMWAAASDRDRVRFLRHLRPWWDIHRHRLAPEVARSMEEMRASGTLDIHAGRIVSVEPAASALRVTWRPRGEASPRTVAVRWLINCTGPQGDLLRADQPLLRHLVASGAIRPDRLRIGIDVDAQGRTLSADGVANEWLYALGPMTRGAFWEIVAVPDIRQQCWAVARKLTNAHWVGGEGL